MALQKHISEEDINRQFINIDKIAEMKGLKSNRSLRVEINKGNKSKYIAREVNTKGGKTYEILITTLGAGTPIKNH